MSMLKKKNLQD